MNIVLYLAVSSKRSTGCTPDSATDLHTKLIANDIRIDALAATPARRAFSSPRRLPTLRGRLNGGTSAIRRGGGDLPHGRSHAQSKRRLVGSRARDKQNRLGRERDGA